MKIFLILNTIFLLPTADAYRILVLWPYTGKSHFDVAINFFEELAHRGHEVYVLSHFPRSKHIENFTDLDVSGSYPIRLGVESMESLQNSVIGGLLDLTSIGRNICANLYKHPTVRDLLASNLTFDAVIAEMFNCDCILGFVHRFKAPLIGFSTTSLLPWLFEYTSNPSNPSYISTGFSDMPFLEPDLFQRLTNTYQYVILNLIHRYQSYRFTELARTFFGADMPDVVDISRNMSLMFTNTHFAFNGAHPHVPLVVNVGGIHLKKPKELPKDIKDYLDSSGDQGVIYFNLGSMIRTSTFSPEKWKMLTDAFAEIPQNVLIKWDGEPFVKKNMKSFNWLPQFDVLAHPNIKAFFGHGGMLGCIEAVYNAVPMIAMPVYGDQPSNVEALVARGMAIRVNYNTLTKDILSEALKEIVYSPKYKDNAIRVSAAYRDRPQSAMDTAIYWTEYVIRHKGAHHLRSSAQNLNIFQFLLLDIALIFLIFITSTIVTIRSCIKNLICSSATKLKANKTS